ncbi:hypothetical protein C8F04DRAFT_1255914 [Mycena alexandri]|uniref:Uncharacterized protein n=1 Tax=Mycena alexandri TaxID=1745969 RepID=A0AAD6T2R0_9AGAR|nr:hypothetical protein C8F04DRAFT_1255914 [Mycena alexandri]
MAPSQPPAKKAPDAQQPVNPEAPPASDLERGESYANIDYALYKRITSEHGVVYSYDIACQCNARCSRQGTSTQ